MPHSKRLTDVSQHSPSGDSCRQHSGSSGIGYLLVKFRLPGPLSVLRRPPLLAPHGFASYHAKVVARWLVAEKTGIHRVTLSKIANQHDYNVGTEILDRLCRYFECELGDLAEFIRDD
ncbi:MAG: helix-turn-helix domain-containing protein [Chromatiales bacterium]|nr:helix-turn-helix domain-containing protein [Chromatiales bacterium]